MTSKPKTKTSKMNLNGSPLLLNYSSNKSIYIVTSLVMMSSYCHSHCSNSDLPISEDEGDDEGNGDGNGAGDEDGRMYFT